MTIFKPEKDFDANAVAPIPDRLRKNRKVAILTGDNAEDNEFFYPYYRLTEEGYDVDVITEKGGEFKCKNGAKLKNSMPVESANAAQYELLYIPGGKAPASLRKSEQALRFVREFAATGRPVAAICHGAQVLISAELVKGKKISAWPEIKEEVEEAGATFANEALAIDGQFITSRMPGDLHRHMNGVIETLNKAYKNEKPQPVRPAA